MTTPSTTSCGTLFSTNGVTMLVGIMPSSNSMIMCGSKVTPPSPNTGNRNAATMVVTAVIPMAMRRNRQKILCPRLLSSSTSSRVLMAVTSDRKMIGPMTPERTLSTILRTGDTSSSTTNAFASAGSCRHNTPATAPAITASTMGCLRMLLLSGANGERTEMTLRPRA